MSYFTGKGYGVSDLTDLSGRPLLTYQGPSDKKPILLSDRVAVQFDPTIKQKIDKTILHNDRLDLNLSQAVKSVLGGTSNQELDHKIPLELGGSNLPTNLRLEDHIPGTANTPTDTLENTLALRVESGEISLQFAWEAMAQYKKYKLGEESLEGVDFSISGQFRQILDTLQSLPGGSTSPAVATISKDAQAQLDQNLAILKDTPFNIQARQNYFQSQIKATMESSGMTEDEAIKTIGASIVGYGATQGVDPREMAVALSNIDTRLVGASQGLSTILDLPLDKIFKVLTRLVLVSPVLEIAGIIVVVLTAIFGGPEVLAGIEAVPFLGQVWSLLRISKFLSFGAGLIGISEIINKFAFTFALVIKEAYDNLILSPSQTVQGFKDAEAIAKAVLGTPTKLPSSLSGTGAAKPKIFFGTITQGVLGSAAPFAPHEKDIIESADELLTAAANNLSHFLVALPGKIIYDVRLVSHVYNEDGTVRFGATHEVQVGATKKGVPKYRKITNKFAVLDVHILTDKNVRSRIAEITLGPVDEVAYNPKPSDLAELASKVHGETVTTDIRNLSGVGGNSGNTGTGTSQTRNIGGAGVESFSGGSGSGNLQGGGQAPRKINTNTATQSSPLIPQLINPGQYAATIYLANPSQFFRGVGDYGTTLYQLVVNRVFFYPLIEGGSPLFASDDERASFGNAGGQAAEAKVRLKNDLGIDWYTLPAVNIADLGAKKPPYDVYEPNRNKTGINPYLWPGSLTDLISGKPPAGSAAAATPTTSADVGSAAAPGCAAATLSAWYQANGKPLPKVSERGVTYHLLGLGDQNLYTGTAVENAKLLIALKEQAGCPS